MQSMHQQNTALSQLSFFCTAHAPFLPKRHVQPFSVVLLQQYLRSFKKMTWEPATCKVPYKARSTYCSVFWILNVELHIFMWQINVIVMSKTYIYTPLYTPSNQSSFTVIALVYHLAAQDFLWPTKANIKEKKSLCIWILIIHYNGSSTKKKGTSQP